MEKIIEKISSYNLYNYLFCGIVFALISHVFLNFDFEIGNVIIDTLIYYFIGLTISRFGSLVLEPILKKISFIKYRKYTDFVEASKKDSKINILSRENNVYRTMSSLFLSLILFEIYLFAESKYPPLVNFRFLSLTILFFILYLFAYRKQTKFICERIDFSKTNTK